MKFKLLLLVGIIVCSLKSQSQSIEQNSSWQDLLEALSEHLEENTDLTEILENFNYLSKNPINLNNSTTDDLNKLIILNPLQISNLQNHIKTNGKLLSIIELQSIDGFDIHTINTISPYITVNETSYSKPLTLKNITSNSIGDWFIKFGRNIEKEEGFTTENENKYTGSRERFLNRIKIKHEDNFSMAIIFEKDAGEKFIQNPFDFYAGHVAIYNQKKIKKLVLGDYSLQFGQGLSMWSGFGFGKSADLINIAKRDLGLRAYNSSNEYSFLRGIASTLALSKQIHFTPFISFRKLDAKQSLNTDGTLYQTSINQTGLHRTPSEILNKYSLSQNIFGASLNYVSNPLNIGIIGYQTVFSEEFKTQEATYDKFGFEGKSLSNLGINYNFTHQNIYVFGEFGHSLGSGFAHINGVLISLSAQWSMALQYRNYQKNYHNFFNQALAESSEAINEKGFYNGLNYHLNKKWTFSLYSDVFKFPWLKFRVDAPSKGHEFLKQITYTKSKTFKIQARLKIESKQQNTDEDVVIKYLDQTLKENYRFQIDWQISQRLKFQNRIELLRFRKGNLPIELGQLIYQDINFDPKILGLKGNLRIAYFNTASYNSRIYAYEDDVLYSFNFGNYFGKGFRTYLNLNHSLSKNIKVWARYALSAYQDTESVGSALNEVEGSRKSDLKFQIRYQF